MPNIDETFNMPLDDELSRGKPPKDLGDYLLEQHRSMRKMYEEIAIGVNDTYQMTLKQQGDYADTTLGRPLPMLPSLGMFLIIVSPLEDDMPMIMSAVMKQTVGTAATFSTLASKAGVGSTWNTINVLVQSTGDEIGISHDGSGNEEGEVNVTILGPFLPQGGG
jgi:hypothetical protein